ncbi:MULTISPECIES: ATP-binding protein [Rhodomicrobium]|uniref:sensor histidine kinase n=1 Tax=Rhodomicrobium TaxID=1068 RepID=UPI0014828C5D|nr:MULTISPECIES: ATP-binding protein [Rhodomicrobium]
MTLKSAVRLAIIGAALAGTLALAAAGSAYVAVRAAQGRVAFAGGVTSGAAELNLRTAALFLRGSEDAALQWHRQHESLAASLAGAPPMGGRANRLAARLGRDLGALKATVSSLEAATGSGRDAQIATAQAQSAAIQARAAELQTLMIAAADTTTKAMFLLIGGALMLLALGGGLVLLLLATGLLNRILRLRGIIQAIGRGDLDVEIPIPAGDEMGDVLRELHHMRLGLLQSMGELSRLNLELVGSKAHLEDRVAERTEGLEAANRELEAFSYAVSHDLRAPLRTIAGFSKAVLEDHGPRLDAEGKAMLVRVHRAAGQMTQLVEDLLNLSRLTRPPDLADADLSAIAARIGETLREEEPARSVRLTIQPGLRARCDGRLIAVLLTNLLENAWKFTAQTAHAEIEFGQRAEAGQRTFFVRDNGAGFDMAHRQRLFQPLQRLHSAEAFPGSGIGLATVARIVRLHGGHVWAEGKQGEGASFYFQLGAGEAALPLAPQRTAARARGRETERRVLPLRSALKE